MNNALNELGDEVRSHWSLEGKQKGGGTQIKS